MTPTGYSAAMLERLNACVFGMQRLGAEAERLALVVGRVDIAGSAGVDRQDRDRLTELAKAGDEAATGEGDIVRMGGNEDVCHRGRG